MVDIYFMSRQCYQKHLFYYQIMIACHLSKTRNDVKKRKGTTKGMYQVQVHTGICILATFIKLHDVKTNGMVQSCYTQITFCVTVQAVNCHCTDKGKKKKSYKPST